MVSHMVSHVDFDSTSRPRLALSVDGVTFTVQFDRFDGAHARYRWSVAGDHSHISDDGDDLAIHGRQPDLPHALVELVHFFQSRPDLFPNLRGAMPPTSADTVGIDAACELMGSDR